MNQNKITGKFNKTKTMQLYKKSNIIGKTLERLTKITEITNIRNDRNTAID